MLISLAASLTIAACPFCAKDGKTLASEVQDAAFVVYGRIANARTVANADSGSAGAEAWWRGSPFSWLYPGIFPDGAGDGLLQLHLVCLSPVCLAP